MPDTVTRALLNTQKSKSYNAEFVSEKIVPRGITNHGHEFKLWEGEKVYFERPIIPQKPYGELVKIIDNAIIFDLERMTCFKSLYSILVSVGGCCLVETLLSMYLMFNGHQAGSKEFFRALTVLEKLNIISYATVAIGPKEQYIKKQQQKAIRFVYLTTNGVASQQIFESAFATETEHARTNPNLLSIESLSKKHVASKAKSLLTSSNLIATLIKNQKLSTFEIYPLSFYNDARMLKFKSESNTFFRFSFKNTNFIYLNFRKDSNILKHAISILVALSASLKNRNINVMIHCEDFAMNTEIAKAICAYNSKNIVPIKLNILYTDDFQMTGKKGDGFFYCVKRNELTNKCEKISTGF